MLSFWDFNDENLNVITEYVTKLAETVSGIPHRKKQSLQRWIKNKIKTSSRKRDENKRRLHHFGYQRLISDPVIS